MLVELLEKFEDLFTPVSGDELDARQEEIIQAAEKTGMKRLKPGDTFNIRPNTKTTKSFFKATARSKIFVTGDWSGEVLSVVLYNTDREEKLEGAIWWGNYVIPTVLDSNFWYPAFSNWWAMKHRDRLEEAKDFGDVFKPASKSDLDKRKVIWNVELHQKGKGLDRASKVYKIKSMTSLQAINKFVEKLKQKPGIVAIPDRVYGGWSFVHIAARAEMYSNEGKLMDGNYVIRASEPTGLTQDN